MTTNQAEPGSDHTKRRRVRLDPIVRRKQIVTQATSLIAESGFNAVSLADVANACDVRKSTILHYFPSMKALLIEVLVGRDARDIGAAPRTDLVSVDPGAARELITTKIEDNLHQREIIRLFHVLAAEALASDHPAHGYFRQRSKRARAALCTILSWKRDPPTAALELLAFWEGLELEWLTDPDTDIIPAWLGFADRFFAYA